MSLPSWVGISLARITPAEEARKRLLEGAARLPIGAIAAANRNLVACR